MQLFVYNKTQIEEGLPAQDHARDYFLISLRDPDETIDLPDDRRRRCVFSLEFHDIEAPTAGFIHFTPEMAGSIVRAVTSLPPDLDVVIHCHSGMSRSAAVAAALCRVLGGNENDFLAYPYYPNRLVYRTVRAALRGTYTQENRLRLGVDETF